MSTLRACVVKFKFVSRKIKIYADGSSNKSFGIVVHLGNILCLYNFSQMLWSNFTLPSEKSFVWWFLRDTDISEFSEKEYLRPVICMVKAYLILGRNRVLFNQKLMTSGPRKEAFW